MYRQFAWRRKIQAIQRVPARCVVRRGVRRRLRSQRARPPIQRRLAALPPITVPAITLDGAGDGVAPATDGKAAAARFTGRRAHRRIPRAGHNLPQEEPEAFAAAVMEVSRGDAH